MKVLLVSDYFYPFTPGGSEWSVYELAQALKLNHVDSQVLTLNYGALETEVYQGVRITRIPFSKKITNSRRVVSPIWQNNPLFWITSAFHLIKSIQSIKPDIIHVHGKFLTPAAIISGWVCQKPVIVTVRDKQFLCSIGKCFFDPQRTKACSLWEYLTSDLPWFFNNYVSKNPIAIIYALFGVIWSRISGYIIKFFTLRASEVTTISISQKRYLESNGFKNVEVIYNTASFKKPKTSVSKDKSALFVGKLSKGKGVNLLLDAISLIPSSIKIKFMFAGQIESEQIKNRLQGKAIKSRIRLLGSVEHHALTKLYQEASMVVMPSTYPESFGRAALEGILNGTPVVVANTGALPEIIDDKVTGRVSELTAESLKNAILDVLEREKFYRQNINKFYSQLKEKFMVNPNRQYLKLYKEEIA